MEGKGSETQYKILKNLIQHIYGKSSCRGPGGHSLFGGCWGERSDPEAASIHNYMYIHGGRGFESTRCLISFYFSINLKINF